MTEHCIQKLIMDVEDQIDKILETVTDKDELLKLTDHEIRARKKLARDLYFSIQYYDLRNHQ
mgnify:FL=1|jgi:hypothetical protein